MPSDHTANKEVNLANIGHRQAATLSRTKQHSAYFREREKGVKKKWQDMHSKSTADLFIFFLLALKETRTETAALSNGSWAGQAVLFDFFAVTRTTCIWVPSGYKTE